MFERLVWINLDKYPDRKQHMEETIRSSPFLSACHEIIRHAPTPPHQLLTPRSFPVHAGHYSCLRAHLTVIEQAYVDGLQNVLILEDDIDPEPDFETQIPIIMQRLPTDWLMLYLGGTSQQQHYPLQGRLAVLGGATSTHAYALSRAGMEVCFDWLFHEEKHAIDQMYNRLHQQRLQMGEHRCLCVQPWIVHTLDGYSELDKKWTQGTRTCPPVPAAPPVTTVNEESLRAEIFGGANHHRSEQAFQPVEIHTDTALHRLLQKDIFQPTTEEVANSTHQIKAHYKNEKVKILIPMRELQQDIAPVIGETIDTLIDYFGLGNIYIIDNGLHKKIKETIQSREVNLLSSHEIKGRFDFARLLEILAIDHLDAGLGFSIATGLAHLAIEQCIQPDDWLVKFDGDIANFKQCLLPEYLFYPVAVAPHKAWDYLKIAKVGRNNDTVLAAINGLTA
ncbi:MAG: hypothetical protein AAFP10_04330, partial [Pseudomonadota bacterium]